MTRSLSLGFPIALLATALSAAAAPPVNDGCSTATTIPGLQLPYTRTIDTTQATADGDPAVPCVTSAPGKTVWFAFQPTASDRFVFDATASTPDAYQPVLALYAGSCGGLVPVANACARGRLAADLQAGASYYLLVGGASVVVDPGIRIALNGVDLCTGGPGPGGGDCGASFAVRVGDKLTARAYNRLDDSALTTGTFDWSFGTNSSPATGTGPSVPFTYTAPVAAANVALTWTPPSQAPISRQVTLSVGDAPPALSLAGAGGAFPLAAGETATLPSPGGTLRLTVQRDVPAWRYVYVVPSVANVVSAAGVPFVSDFSVTNMESSETIVGLELWTGAGVRESSPLRVPPRGSRTISDVVRSAFGIEQDFGTLVVSSTGRVTAGARTWAPVPGGGTNGQFALAGDVRSTASAAVLQPGEVGIFPGIRQDSGFRTNVGVYNLGSSACTVEVEARDEAGTLVGTRLVLTVPATRYVQQALSSAVGTGLASGSVFMTNTTAGCSVGGVAYVIDNATQDPYVVSQRKAP